MQSSEIEYRLKPDDPLCFIRIPKTGSTTLLSVLNAKFSADQLCPILEGEIFDSVREDLSQYRFFGAHHGYDIHIPIGRKPVFFTYLRHPVDRAISFFKHRQSDFSDGEFAQFLRAETAKGLKEFICSDNPNVRIRTSNLATRQIAIGLGSRHARPFVPDSKEAKYSDEELLAMAKAHLDEFAFIGLTEQFQASLFLMAYTFGWPPVTHYQNRRVNPQSLSSKNVDPETAAAILSVNQLDMQLYDYGQQIFADRWQQMLRELQERYGTDSLLAERFSDPDLAHLRPALDDPSVRQALINLLEKNYERRYAEFNRKPEKLICFNSLQAIPGTGWQRRRWIGPGTEATLDFPLAADADLTIRIYINNSAAPDILDSFQLQVNETPIPLKPIVRRERAALFEGKISQAVLETPKPFSRLRLAVNRTVALPKLLQDGTSDELLVGVAVQQVQIFADRKALPQPHKYLLFLHKDPVWAEVAHFIEHHLKDGEQMAGPGELMERFPQCCWFYGDSFEAVPNLKWVVIRKGWLQQVKADALNQTLAKMQPVFANPVFVVFSSRRDLQPLDAQEPDVAAFWQAWQPHPPFSEAKPLQKVLGGFKKRLGRR
jgi:hypothetical protein